MKITEFARHLGVSHVAVHKAVGTGALDGAVSWIKRANGSRYAEIIDLPLATRLWTARPGSRAPALAARKAAASTQPAEGDGAAPAEPALDGEADPMDIHEARLRFEAARAQREELKLEEERGDVIAVERAKEIYGRQIAEAKTAVMALGKHARSRIPHLTTDDVTTIEELCREALEGLATEAIENELRHELD